jgi:RNA polymerase sigma-32 factor
MLTDSMVKKKDKSLVPQHAIVPPSYLEDPLKAYLIEINRYPYLTEQEEYALALRYRESQDPEAARQLVVAHLRMVVKIAMEYRRAYHNVLDLVQEGNVGLMKAMKKFDPDKGARFSYYASWWIRAYIIKYILDNFRLIKIGTTQAQRKLFFNLMKEKKKIEDMGYYAGPQLIAERLNVKPEEVEEMEKRMSQSEASFDAPIPGESGSLLNEFIADDQQSEEETISQRELHDKLLENMDDFIQSLNDKEKYIFQNRIYSELPQTLETIGQKYGVTRERIRQIEEKIMSKLKSHFKDLRDTPS